MQERAPSASARIMSAPVRTPESNITSISEPTASTTRGSAAIADGAPSSWRPPWLDTLMASAPVVTAILASSTSRMPLRISLPGHRLLTHSTSFQRQRRVELARGPCGQRVDVLHALHVAGEIAEGLALALEDRQRPGRLGHDVDDVPDLDLRRHGQAVAHVGVALAEHLQIDGQHQRAAFRRRRALDQFADEAAVAHDVELEPERLVDRAGHVLDRIDRHGGERVGDAGRLRRAAGHDLAVAVHHAAEPDRPERERHRHLLAEDGGRGAALVDVHQHALAQLDASRSRRGWRAASPAL